MEMVRWDDLRTEKDVDTVATILIRKITQYMKKNTSTRSANRRRIAKNGWNTTGLLKSVNRKNELYKKLMREPNNQELKMQYIYYRNLVQKLIERAKKNYTQKQIVKANHRSKVLWNLVQESCNESKPITNIEELEGQNEVEGVEKIFEEFKYHKAPGQDGIRAKILKKVKKEVSEPLRI
ncbi:hypothetical protein HHI36_023447 [Cryptolaemus montrouzieri]|uniref:Endonuclease-reverse transcriptase n=1 Tax=Cryptolaemus montrouzieri TaxID=559131 RepID=A0ABD2PGR9_9CUCU